MDYKALLKRYIGHVIWTNGDSHIYSLPNDSVHHRPLFTADEEIELKKLEEKVMQEYPELNK